MALNGTTTDREVNRDEALSHLAAWRANNAIALGTAGNEIAYFAGTDYPDQAYFNNFFDVLDDFADRDMTFGIDWAVQFLTVPLTAVYDVCDGQTSSACATLLASNTPVTVRIAIADSFDTSFPPAVFFAANSVRFEDNPSAAPSAARVTLNQPADIDAQGGRATYTATLRDSVGNPINAANTVTLTLSTAPIGGVFYDQLTNGSVITTVDIPAGSATANFFFEAPTAASYTVIASSSAFPDARDAIIVEANATSTDVTDALTVLTNFNPGSPTEPSADDYETIGVTVTPADVPGINTIIKGLNPEDRDTAAKIQVIVDVYGDIKTNADGNPANEPGLTAAEIKLLGLPNKEEPFTAAQADLYNELLGKRQPGDVDTFEELKAISDVVIKVFGTREDAAYTPAMTVADFEVLGITGVTEDNLPVVISDVGPGVGTEDASSVANIQARVNRGISGYTTNLAAINARFSDNTNPAPNATTYANIGVTGIPSSPVAGHINTILQSLYDQEAQSFTRIGIQAVVDLYNEIQTAANGNPATTPGLDADEFATLSLTAIQTPQQVSLANSVLGGAGAGEADTLPEIKALTDISQAIIALAGGAPSNTVTAADLATIGITGVTSANEAAVLAAIANTPNNGSAVDTIAKIQAIVNSLANPPTETEIEVIITFDPDVDNDPSPADYENAGVFGVNPDNVTEINEIVGEVVDGTPEDEPLTPADIQAAVNTYIEIQTFADGDPDNDPALTAEDYQAMGLFQITSEAAANLLNDILGARTQTEVDTLAKIKPFADIANAIATLASGEEATLTVANFTTIGVTGVDADSLADLLDAIAGSPKDGSLVDSIAELQGIVTIVTATPDPAAITTLVNYDPTTDPAPGADTYEDAGIVGVNTNNVTPINDLINKIPRDEPLTPADIQAIVNAYNEVLAAADGDATKTGQLTKEQFAVLGLVDIDEVGETNLLNDIIGSSNPTDVNTYAALKKLADIVTEIIGAAGGTGGDDLTASDFTDIGVIGVTDDNVGEVVDAIGDTPDDGTRADSVDELQDIVDATTTDVPDATVETFVDSTNKDVTGYGNAGVSGVDEDNLTTINAWVDTTKTSNPDQTGTQAGLQALVNAVNAVLAGTGSGEGTPATVSLAQFEILGLDEIDTATEQALMNAVIGNMPSSPAPTPTSLAATAAAVSKASALAGGTSTTALSAAELASLGLTATTADAVALVNDAIKAGGSSSVTNLANLIKADAAAVKIAVAANGNAASQPDLNRADYASLGVSVADELQVQFMNAFVGRQDGVSSIAELTSAAAIIGRIMTQVNGGQPSPALGTADFSSIGVTGVNPGNLGLVTQRLTEATAADFNTADPIATLQALVSQAVDEYASQAVPVPSLSVWALWLMAFLMLLIAMGAGRVRERLIP